MAKQQQVLLFLVEGYTDKITFELAMNKLIDQENIQFVITDGDLTSNDEIAANMLAGSIGSLVRITANRYDFQHKNFYKIVHLIDTDAAFVSADKVLDIRKNKKLSDMNAELFYDSENGIWTKNINGILRRNVNKQKKVQILQYLKSVWKGIPYEVYYMSMNLEHVLYQLPNATQRQKAQLADEKEAEWAGNPQKLVQFFQQEKIALGGDDYQASWQFIKQDNHSLMRCSNFNIFFQKAEKEKIISYTLPKRK